MTRSRLSRKVGWSFACAVAAVLLFAAALPADAITYGWNDGDAHPSVGAIVVGFRGRTFEFCSGSLVSERVFLTAGHCTDALAYYQIPMDSIWVSFASYIYGNAGALRPVAAYFNHPDYWWGPQSDPHDVGVLILRDAATDLTPVDLAPAGYLDGLQDAGTIKDTRFINVGYGQNELFNVTGYRQMSYSSLMNLHDAWVYLSQNNHTGDGGTCYGDSGGPTFVRGEDGGELQVAVTSWGDGACKATNINYRVDTVSSLGFLEDMVATYG